MKYFVANRREGVKGKEQYSLKVSKSEWLQPKLKMKTHYLPLILKINIM